MSKGQKPNTVDLSTDATIVISAPHYEIHNGDHYELKDIVDLAISNVRDIQITTPDTAKWAHLTFEFDSENECEWYLYRNVNIILAGSAANVQNSHGNSAKTSGLVVKHINNTSVANANDDTAVAGATIVLHGRIGSGQRSGGHSHDVERILKQGEDYTLRFIATAAGFVDYHFTWYEHTNDGGDY